MGLCHSKSECSEKTWWREYVAACLKHPELNCFNMEAKKQVQNMFRAASKKVLEEGAVTVAATKGEETCEIFFGFLHQATSSMLSTNMVAIEAIEEIVKASKSEVWGKNPDLTQLVDEYCKNSLAMLCLCSEVKISIGTTRSSQLLLQDPVWREWDSFERMHDSNKQLLQKLKTKMGEKKKKIKSAKMWSKISFIVFGALATTLGISTVVAAVIAAPPAIVGALVVSSTLPITSVGGWIKSFWQGHAHEIQDEYNVFEKMERHTEIHIIEFASLHVSTLGLKECFKAMDSTIGFIDRLGGDTMALQLVVEDLEDLENRRQKFVRDLDTLEECITKCKTRINCAIYVILI